MILDVSIAYQKLVDSGAFFSLEEAREIVRTGGVASSHNVDADKIVGTWFRLARSFFNRNPHEEKKGWIHPFPIDTVQHVLDFRKEEGFFRTSLPSERFLQEMVGVFVEGEGGCKNSWVFLCDRLNKKTQEKTAFAEMFVLEDKGTLVGTIFETTGTADLPKNYKQVTVYRRKSDCQFLPV